MMKREDKPPRCSLPGGDQNRNLSGDILKLHNCDLWHWCEKTGKYRSGKKEEFEKLLQIHAQLHRIAQEIIWYEGVPGSDVGIHAMEHFNDLWQQLRNRIKTIDRYSS
ncbi:MAG: CZB domain-containing protein [Magnetococcales bacterium]|nr:CZB domain-containing protein [Magnetococcales bacterium]